MKSPETHSEKGFPRLLIYTGTAIITVLLLHAGDLISTLVAERFSLLLLIFGAFILAQFLTDYFLEEFIMELKGNSLIRWISAPLGIFFCFLIYSILNLSTTLLF